MRGSSVRLERVKIDLQPPFKDIWKSGYLVPGSEGRKMVQLYNSQDDRTTLSYARYLVSVREGRFLGVDEDVDHDDEDKTNDALENLILRTKTAHREKTAAHRKSRPSRAEHGIGMYSHQKCRCDVCKAAWALKTREYRLAARTRKSG